jgi:hypothetical protein
MIRSQANLAAENMEYFRADDESWGGEEMLVWAGLVVAR